MTKEKHERALNAIETMTLEEFLKHQAQLWHGFRNPLWTLNDYLGMSEVAWREVHTGGN